MVRGIVMQAPSWWSGMRAMPPIVFPWSVEMAARFQALHGYDLITNLPALLADTGARAVRVRQDYWATALTMARECFWQPWRDFADSNMLYLRVDFEGGASLNELVARYGDVVPLAQLADECGVSPYGAADNAALPRLLSSVAELKGAPALTRRHLETASYAELHHHLQDGVSRFESAENVRMFRPTPRCAMIT
jgi:hypothetical protein